MLYQTINIKKFPSFNWKHEFPFYTKFDIKFDIVNKFQSYFMINWNNLIIFDFFVFHTKIIIIIFDNFWHYSFLWNLGDMVIFIVRRGNLILFGVFLDMFSVFQIYPKLVQYLKVGLLYNFATEPENNQELGEALCKYASTGYLSRSVLNLY